MVNTIELFCGTKSFSKVAKAKGYNTFTVDIDKQFNPDLVSDIMDLDISKLPKNPLIVWASPPCEKFSVATIGRNWNRDHTPKTNEAREALKLVLKTIELIKELKPKYWIIENPRGKLRKLIDFGDRYTVAYCQYGDNRKKPTDLWTNITTWKPKEVCKNGASCHISAPRGSNTGTQGLKNKILRGVIPPELIKEILQSIEE
jgi:site-specific DNA-cytosine methylase|tara:strand:+ start:2803 stop:3408 length:606 start_codon:yes stop_codon:yes gene_type:complete